MELSLPPLPPARVVLLSGQAVELSPPPSPSEPVGAIRARVAAALGLDVERVMLVAGTRILQNAWSTADSVRNTGERDLTALVTENIMDTDDPQHVAEYASDIFRGFLRKNCPSTLAPVVQPIAAVEATAGGPGPGGAEEQQQGVDRTSRCVLIDWLVEEHHKYNLRSETLFLTVALVDAFLQRRRTAARELRLVGVAALLIAAKFEEIYPPEIRDLVYITDHEYSAEDIKSMEVLILSVLNFAVAGQTAAHFMDRYQRANHCSELQGRLVQYFLELALTDTIVLHVAPFTLAAAAVFLVNRLSGHLPAWPASMVNYTGQAEGELLACASKLHRLVVDSKYSAFQRVRNKLEKDPPLRELVRAVEEAGSAG